MRTSAVLFLATGLCFSACSQQDDVVAVEDVSAVTAAGADSAIADEGDERPDQEVDATTVVIVAVDVPEGVDDLAGNVIVTLEDISYTDAEAIIIIEEEIPAAQLAEQQYEVPIFLPLPLDGSIDVTATVHIDVDESGTVSPGDWISPELAMIEIGPEARVAVTIVQI